MERKKEEEEEGGERDEWSLNVGSIFMARIIILEPEDTQIERDSYRF